MTGWYRDIYPCSACEHGPFISSYAHCKKEHHVTHVDGCKDCGTLVNWKWYFRKEVCPDFSHVEPHDPSGS